jgi:pyridoxal phosphate enzyme (YggS family)
MVDLIRGLRPDVVRANLDRVRDEIAAAGRDPDSVQVLAAVKYLPLEELPALAEGGVTLVGENRAQDLVAKAQAFPGRFTWDFIGTLQSRKVPLLLGHVRYIQTLASDSALRQLERNAEEAREHGVRVLVEVNVAGEAGKAGIAPDALPGFLERCPIEVAGLMTMPPLAADPEDSRPHFRALSELAARHGLPELSMGTSQDYPVALQEGATIIRLGSTLLRPSAP